MIMTTHLAQCDVCWETFPDLSDMRGEPKKKLIETLKKNGFRIGGGGHLICSTCVGRLEPPNRGKSE